jgi:hypothetical protein
MRVRAPWLLMRAITTIKLLAACNEGAPGKRVSLQYLGLSCVRLWFGRVELATLSSRLPFVSPW